MLASFRPASNSLNRRAAHTAGALFAVLGLSATPALAAHTPKAGPGAPAICENQVFSQPFSAFEDLRYFTLVPGGEFNSAEAGWTLSGGASLITTTRPDGTTGGALDLPAGATATSPPMCVTLAYPIARAWVNGAKGSAGVAVRVSYEGTKSELEPADAGKVKARHGQWTLGEFKVKPQIAGKEEAPRNVRFVFEGKPGTHSQLYDVYVDPRMSR